MASSPNTIFAKQYRPEWKLCFKFKRCGADDRAGLFGRLQRELYSHLRLRHEVSTLRRHVEAGQACGTRSSRDGQHVGIEQCDSQQWLQCLDDEQFFEFREQSECGQRQAHRSNVFKRQQVTVAALSPPDQAPVTRGVQEKD